MAWGAETSVSFTGVDGVGDGGGGDTTAYKQKNIHKFFFSPKKTIDPVALAAIDSSDCKSFCPIH